MECRFLQHGISVAYDHVLKPCCDWRYDQTWSRHNNVHDISIQDWHQSSAIQNSIKLLAQERWPDQCQGCKNTEGQGRFDSMRGNGNHAYSHYNKDDITLEIRPGSTCNFACQTCWPEASSRVAQFYHQSGLIDIKEVNSTSMHSFDWLVPVQHRIRDIVVLGGEPFYDKACRNFLDWAVHNTRSRMTMFTNGSAVDFDWVARYQQPLCLVVSFDAVGRPAEYIRYGTDWDQVWHNYQRLKIYDHVELRVNITMSIYNYLYVADLLSLLSQDWPDCVTFGSPRQSWMNEWALPSASRSTVIDGLRKSLSLLDQTVIEKDQKHNAINAIVSVVQNLETHRPWNIDDTARFRDFYQRMDRAKGVRMQDYCAELFRAIEQPGH